MEWSLWGLKLHADLKKRGLCLSQTCLGFSLGRQPRTGFEVRLAVSTYLMFCRSLNLVLIFFLVFLSLLTNGSSFLVFLFFFFFFFSISLKALGTKDHVMTLVSPPVAGKKG